MYMYVKYKKKNTSECILFTFDKNFTILDLKIQTLEAEWISYGRMFHLSTIL